jgi:antitoxin component YwqK of YwqJK toxin-antitoxin module
LFGHYLLYGEGEFVNGKREKTWKLYVLEDKTFKKILQQELHYVNGEKEGAFNYFFPSGAIGTEGKYAANYLEGELKSYYEDGKQYGIRHYKHGLRVGKHTYVFPNGKLEAELNFVKDTLNGLYQVNYENGNTKEIFTYSMGMATGNYKYYYENGQLWVEKEYKEGLLLNVKGNFDQKGNERDKGTLLDGNGTVVFYTEEGKVYSEETYKNGKKINEVNK